jgi:hypothetical protein
LKILYIIGNGFDLNLGMKTTYKDFYEYYSSIQSTKNKVNDLKKSISSNYNNWSDLELALGQYTEELKTLVDFDEVFEDIGEHLSQYLKNEESKFDSKRVNQEKFFDNLVKPEDFLPAADYNVIKSYKNGFTGRQWHIDIVTFNYTTIIEKIIGGRSNIEIGSHPKNAANIILRGVEHIHGYVDKNMVLGVNDISQLKNKDFHTNQDVLEAIVKEKCNRAHKHGIDSSFKSKIKKADLICIFGASIGDTDNMWWELLGEKLKSKPLPLIIFTKGEEVISPRISYKTNRTVRKIREYFLRKTKLNDNEKERIRENVYIALDSLMFKEIIA